MHNFIGCMDLNSDCPNDINECWRSDVRVSCPKTCGACSRKFYLINI